MQAAQVSGGTVLRAGHCMPVFLRAQQPVSSKIAGDIGCSHLPGNVLLLSQHMARSELKVDCKVSGRCCTSCLAEKSRLCKQNPTTSMLPGIANSVLQQQRQSASSSGASVASVARVNWQQVSGSPKDMSAGPGTGKQSRPSL